MRYIRTENGIYESEHPSKIVIHKEIAFKPDGTFKTFNYELELKAGEILAEADTIEELCDGFYLDDLLLKRFNKYGVFESNEFEKFKDLVDGYKKGAIPVIGYGFIKTNKGLIYIAKMDNEGKLVLI